MFKIIPLNPSHLDAVCEIETASFSAPWSRETLEEDIKKPYSLYFVALENERVLGYAGMWHIVGEGHITNIAVKPEERRRGVGEALVDALIDEAVRREIEELILEVRVHNYNAQRLYLRKGFILERIRKNYYSDTGEDALILRKDLGENNGA